MEPINHWCTDEQHELAVRYVKAWSDAQSPYIEDDPMDAPEVVEIAAKLAEENLFMAYNAFEECFNLVELNGNPNIWIVDTIYY